MPDILLLWKGKMFVGIAQEERDNDHFVFYLERFDSFWIMTSEEFVKEFVRNKTGRNKGKRSIWFNGRRRNIETGGYEEHRKPQFKKYIAEDFSRLADSAFADFPLLPALPDW